MNDMPTKHQVFKTIANSESCNYPWCLKYPWYSGLAEWIIIIIQNSTKYTIQTNSIHMIMWLDSLYFAVFDEAGNLPGDPMAVLEQQNQAEFEHDKKQVSPIVADAVNLILFLELDGPAVCTQDRVERKQQKPVVIFPWFTFALINLALWIYGAADLPAIF